jgi:transposase InsO family protein
VPISEYKVAKIMKLNNLKSLIVRKKRRNDPKNTNVNVPDLIQQNFVANKPYEKLFTDITYYEINGGHYYISSIIDSFNNQVLAFSISNNCDTKLVIDMLNKISVNITNATVHTDHGTQYTSYEYQE